MEERIGVAQRRLQDDLRRLPVNDHHRRRRCEDVAVARLFDPTFAEEKVEALEETLVDVDGRDAVVETRVVLGRVVFVRDVFVARQRAFQMRFSLSEFSSLEFASADIEDFARRTGRAALTRSNCSIVCRGATPI